MVKINGMDEAILGVTVGDELENILVYSIEKIVEVLIKQRGMTGLEAWDYFDYNIAGAYVGSSGPKLVYTEYELFLEE